MDMRTGAAPGRAQQAHALMKLHGVADFDINSVKMSVTCPHAMAVIDLDQIAIGTKAARIGHDPAGGCQNRRLKRGHEVEAVMKSRLTREGIDAPSEAARQVIIDIERAYEGNGGERRLQTDEPVHRAF